MLLTPDAELRGVSRSISSTGSSTACLPRRRCVPLARDGSSRRPCRAARPADRLPASRPPCSASVAYVAGWQLGWVELMVVAAACLLALAARGAVRGRPARKLHLQRTIAPPRVTVGETCVAELRRGNPGKAPTRRVTHRRAPRRRAAITVEVPGAVGRRTSTLAVPAPDRAPRRAQRSARPCSPASRPGRAAAPRRSLTPRSRTCGCILAGGSCDRCRSASPRISKARPPTPRRPATSRSTPFAPYDSATTPGTSTGCRRARSGQVMVRHYVDNRRPHLWVMIDGDPAPSPATSSRPRSRSRPRWWCRR